MLTPVISITQSRCIAGLDGSSCSPAVHGLFGHPQLTPSFTNEIFTHSLAVIEAQPLLQGFTALPDSLQVT